MAGATNRQLKALGFRPAAVETIRSLTGGRLSIRSAILAAVKAGIPIREKPVTSDKRTEAWVTKMASGLRATRLRMPGQMVLRARERKDAAAAAFGRYNRASLREQMAAERASHRGDDAAVARHLSRSDAYMAKASGWRKAAKRHEKRTTQR